MNPPNEVMWVHVVRVISIFFVVWIHSAAQVFFFGAPFDGYAWWIANIYDSSVRVCVPMLFMLSGYLLLGKTEPLNSFFKKRVKKVVVPLLVWSILFLAWIHAYEYAHPSVASSMTPEYLGAVHAGGWGALLVMLWIPIYYHLWFLYVLFGVYLLMPLLRIMVQHAPTHLLWYFVALSVVSSFILPGAEKLTDTKNNIHLAMASGTLGYVVLGHLLGNLQITPRLFRAAVIALLCGTLMTIVGTYYFTAMNKGVLNHVMWGETPNIMLATAGLFIVIRYLVDRSNSLQSGIIKAVLIRLSSASFGIYLVHVMFIYAFAESFFGFRLSALSGDPLWVVPLIAVTTYLSSFAVIAVLQKTPLLRHIVP